MTNLKPSASLPKIDIEDFGFTKIKRKEVKQSNLKLEYEIDSNRKLSDIDQKSESSLKAFAL